MQRKAAYAHDTGHDSILGFGVEGRGITRNVTGQLTNLGFILSVQGLGFRHDIGRDVGHVTEHVTEH